MTNLKKLTILILLIASMLILGCGNKEKKNILGVGGSIGGNGNGDIVTTNPGTGDAITVKSDAVQGTINWQDSTSPGLNSSKVGRLATGVRIYLVKIKDIDAYSWDTKIFATVITDEKGRFVFPNLPPAWYKVGTADVIDGFYNANGNLWYSTMASSIDILLNKSSAVITNITLYKPYTGKAPASTAIEYKYINISLPGVYMWQGSTDSNFTSSTGNGTSLTSAGTSMGSTMYYRWKFCYGNPISTKISETGTTVTYNLFLPSTISDWSDTVYIP